MKILVIDKTEKGARGLELARRLAQVSSEEVGLSTLRKDGPASLWVDGRGTMSRATGHFQQSWQLVLRHYPDSDIKVHLSGEGVEIGYGGGGPEAGRGGAWHLSSAVTTTLIARWEEAWLRELVDWAALAPPARQAAALPRLLNRPAPDALLAYHLLSLLDTQPEPDVRQAAIAEAKAIAGENGAPLSIDDAAARASFIRNWC